MPADATPPVSRELPSELPAGSSSPSSSQASPSAKSGLPQELRQLRDAIDSIDEDILAALTRRFEVTARVGRLKAAHGLDSVDPVREQEKLQRLRDLAAQKGLNSDFVDALFQLLFNEVVKNHRMFLAGKL